MKNKYMEVEKKKVKNEDKKKGFFSIKFQINEGF